MRTEKKYIEHAGLKDATHIEVSVYYSKGGYSHIIGKPAPRGYFVSATPVSKRDGMVSFTMFSGRRRLLFETGRYSAKQFKLALEMAKDVEGELVSAVVAENKAA